MESLPPFIDPACIRLAITPLAARPARRLRSLRSLPATRTVHERLAVSYWDTPDGSVRSDRHALQLVRIGAGSWVERVYQEESDGHFRIVREAYIDAGCPDAEAAGTLGVERGALRPVVSMRIERSRCTLRLADDTSVALSIDRGSVSGDGANGQRRRMLELGLVLVRGSADRVYALASQIVAESASSVRVLLGDETQRAYRLLDGVAARGRSALDPVGEEGVSAASLSCRAVAQCLAQIATNLAGASASDAEALHQFRVGVRRLRAASAIGRAADLARPPHDARTELKWLWSLLGAARDLDVFATETWPAAVGETKRTRVGSRLAPAIAELRAASHARLRRALSQKRFQQLLLSLDAYHHRQRVEAAEADRDEAMSDRARKVAQRLLDAHARKVHRRGRKIARLSDAGLHRLRIDAKRLRYLGEFFAPLFVREAAERYLARVAALQTVLGRMNDLAVGEKFVRDVEARCGKGRGGAMALYETYSMSAARRLRRRLAKETRRLAETAPFWK